MSAAVAAACPEAVDRLDCLEMIYWSTILGRAGRRRRAGRQRGELTILVLV